MTENWGMNCWVLGHGMENRLLTDFALYRVLPVKTFYRLTIGKVKASKSLITILCRPASIGLRVWCVGTSTPHLDAIFFQGLMVQHSISILVLSPLYRSIRSPESRLLLQNDEAKEGERACLVSKSHDKGASISYRIRAVQYYIAPKEVYINCETLRIWKSILNSLPFCVWNYTVQKITDQADALQSRVYFMGGDSKGGAWCMMPLNWVNYTWIQDEWQWQTMTNYPTVRRRTPILALENGLDMEFKPRTPKVELARYP